MALKKKKSKKTSTKGKSAKKRLERRAEEDDFEVYAPSSEDADDPDDVERKDYLTLAEGTSVLGILPPLRKWGIKKPWVCCSAHFFGDDMEKIIGGDLPDGMPKEQGCLYWISDRKKKCAWDQQAGKWKRSRSRRERELGEAIYAGQRVVCNAVLFREGKTEIDPGDLFPQTFAFGKKILEPLNAALHDGDLVCGPREMTLVRIKRVGTGRNTDYPATKVLTRQRVKIEKAWLKEMTDLREKVPVVPDRREVAQWAELLLTGGDIDDDEDFDDDEEDPF